MRYKARRRRLSTRIRWKVPEKAKHRECELCGRRLKLDEHFYCKMCWDKVLYGDYENGIV